LLPHLGEWETKSVFRKLFFVAIAVSTTVLVGAGGGVLVAILGTSLFGISERDVPDAIAYSGMGVGIIAAAVYYGLSVRRQLRESRARIRDPAYRAELQRLGLLR
jgi:hypothetical protein